MFTDPAVSDYSLQTESPAVDADDTTHATPDDFNGNPRAVDGDSSGSAEPDIGAYERQ